MSSKYISLRQDLKDGKIEEVRSHLNQHYIDLYSQNGQGRTILHLAVLDGNELMVELILQIASRPSLRPFSRQLNCQDKNGATPLYHGAYYGYIAIVKRLIVFDRSILDLPEDYGWTPLHAAAWKGHAKTVDVLLQAGSRSLNAQTRYGATPLNCAARSGSISVVNTLLRWKSTGLDTPDIYGRTPLHWSTVEGRNLMVEFLISIGAQSLNTLDIEGHTPLDLAGEEVRMILVAVGATGKESTLNSLPEMTEGEILEIRNRIHFRYSLVSRLWFEI